VNGDLAKKFMNHPVPVKFSECKGWFSYTILYVHVPQQAPWEFEGQQADDQFRDKWTERSKSLDHHPTHLILVQWSLGYHGITTNP
jgi:hypothetical protein